MGATNLCLCYAPEKCGKFDFVDCWFSASSALELTSPSSIFLGFIMSNPVGHTNSYIDQDGPPPPDHDDEWLLLPSGPSGPAKDAASCCHAHSLASRTPGVRRSSSPSSAPPAKRMNGKRQKTSDAREDLCCFCSTTSSCTSRNCSCAMAGRPCHVVTPGRAIDAPTRLRHTIG